jgi:hypothetical protein
MWRESGDVDTVAVQNGAMNQNPPRTGEYVSGWIDNEALYRGCARKTFSFPMRSSNSVLSNCSITCWLIPRVVQKLNPVICGGKQRTNTWRRWTGPVPSGRLRGIGICCPRRVVTAGVRVQDASQMSLIQNQEIIQTLVTYGSSSVRHMRWRWAPEKEYEYMACRHLSVNVECGHRRSGRGRRYSRSMCWQGWRVKSESTSHNTQHASRITNHVSNSGQTGRCCAG